MFWKRTLLPLAALLIADATLADHRPCRPVGSWLLTVTFLDPNPDDGMPPPMFSELLVLNADRTLTESNNILNPNTPIELVPPFFPASTGSDGFGTWKRKRGCKVEFSFLKFVFAGEPRPGETPLAPPGFPIGFFKVSGVAKIRGDHFSSDLGKIQAEMILGRDPLADDAVRIPAGPSTSTGMRLLPTD